jgi:hypothetical protein
MQITIKINTESAAFEDCSAVEVARILRKLAGKIDGEDGVNPRALLDVNGNKCGSVEVEN